MSTVSPRRVAPAPLAGAVRTVNRWGLLAGVTGFYGNVLLLVLFTTPADGPWSWTGPASDTTGIVSPLAMIPVAAALRTVCGGRRGLGAISSLAIVAMAGMAAVSMLFVLGGVSFAMSVDSSYVGLAFMFGWVFAAGLAGRTSGRLPRQISNCGAALGAAGLAGSVLLLQIFDQRLAILGVLETGENHFGAWHELSRICEIRIECRLIPRIPGVLIGG